MSDPAYDAEFQCHGPMQRVDLSTLTGVAETAGVAAYWCPDCGVWRHAFRRSESQLRALVETNMPHFIQEMQR